MATNVNNEPAGNDPRSTPQLLKDVSNEMTGLVRGELELARAEVQEGVSKMAIGVVAIVGGLMVAFVALIILLQAVVQALDDAGLKEWAAALIVGGVIALVALAMVVKGQSNLKNASILPRRAVKHSQADARMAKEHV